MAILIDLNQVLISNLMQQINSNPKVKLDENLIRHMVLNSLRSYVKQFKEKYGEVIVACDSKRSWRRDFYPFHNPAAFCNISSSENLLSTFSDFNFAFIFFTCSGKA